MRNYDELVTAALATGTFADYVGDGYSVPWEVALPLNLPIGYTLWTYKAYLDANWPDGAKLHDWCYTPYGSLINVTREESDLALFEYINRFSPIDAAIVYAAVRAGGFPFFGTSQTGYTGSQVERSTHNIAETNRLKSGVATMPSKIVMLINGLTEKAPPDPQLGYAGSFHAFGVTESFWLNLTNFATITNRVHEICLARAGLLPLNCEIVAARVYTDGVGTSRLIPLGYRGDTGVLNLAGDAILCQTQTSGVLFQRKFWIHCVPDEQVQNGEWQPTANYKQRTIAYLNKLIAYAMWYAQARTNQVGIVTVTSAGLVTFGNAHGFNVGDQVRITRVYLSSLGRFYGGTFRVATVGPLSTQLTLNGWPAYNGAGGIAFTKGTQFVGMTDVDVLRGGIRKVGRPFTVYHGRRSKRKPSLTQ